MWDSLFISATVEARNGKIGTQHEFMFTLPNKFQDQTRQRLNQERATPFSLMMMMQQCILYVPSKTDGYPDQSTKWNQTENVSGKKTKN